MSVVVAEPPDGGVTVMPDSMIPKYPPYTLAYFLGRGRLDFPASPQAGFADSGTGLLVARDIPSADADLAGTGVLFAASVHSYANFTGAGQLTAETDPSITTAFAGQGALVTRATAAVAGKFTGSGSLTSATAPRASAAYGGAGVLAAAVEFDSVRMYKDNNSFNVSAVDPSFVDVPGWVADTTNYPKSVVSSNALVIANGGSGITIAAEVVVRNSSFSQRTAKTQITRNGVEIASGSISLGYQVSGTITMQATNLTLNSGDLIKIRANGNESNAIAVLSGAATFVHAYRP
ncbi:hypothetical protein IU485_28110 [Nocardia cyriacigeorgica]|uniref:hypothetical protein n=1 Tax=Nocardia cyriacigeorgica TaxID=135487 RepID=UPI001893E525|nr:hypothetical protein [Nocardia cyriacigeorgica]MBF6085238.1 hypothetical protein [Nocardia cyriacigeorgica]